MKKLKGLVKYFVFLLPTRNIIVFESYPDCTGNTKAVFDELIRRGYNSKYKMVWLLQHSEPEDHEKIHNVGYYKSGVALFLRYCFAKLFISENSFLEKIRNKGQYSIYLTHGAPFKCDIGYYKIPDGIDEMVDLSPYYVELERLSLKDRNRAMKFNSLGSPRNDVLLSKDRKDAHALFPLHSFSKLVYWMPTFRQHKGVDLNHSTISMPILHDEKAAATLNEMASKHGVLIVVKPHPAQDVSRIKAMEMSNIVFIDDAFLGDHGWTNYELLGSSDALLTDYSSVFHDYLLTDRPIGLCWEDFDDYKEMEGFVIDINLVGTGGEKLYTVEDLCGFIERISSDVDLLKEERAKLKGIFFPNGVHEATGPVTDRIEEILKTL